MHSIIFKAIASSRVVRTSPLSIIASLLAVTVLLVAAGQFAKPLDVVMSWAIFSGAPDVSAIGDVDRWMQERAPWVAGMSWLVLLAALAWSYAWLANKGYWLFDKVRGPAFFWICAAALAQVGFFPWSLSVGELTRVVIPLALLTALGIYVVGKQVDDRERHWSAIAALVGGIVLVVFWLPAMALSAVGGRSDHSSSESDVKVG